jgi:hypothetical protein
MCPEIAHFSAYFMDFFGKLKKNTRDSFFQSQRRIKRIIIWHMIDHPVIRPLVRPMGLESIL